MAFNSSKFLIIIIMDTLGLNSSMADHQLDSSHSGDQFDIIYANTPKLNCIFFTALVNKRFSRHFIH